MNLDSRLICECGKERNLFAFLVKIGYSRESLTTNFRALTAEIEDIVPRLRCSDCSQKGTISIKPSKAAVKTTRTKKSVSAYADKYIATDQSINRIFHHQNCGYAKNIRREDQVFFDTREEAIKRFYDPCKSCRP